jgi:uncharacterized protein
MSTADPLRIPIADLLRRPGAAREFAVQAQVGGGPATTSAPRDRPEAQLHGRLDQLGNGVAQVAPGESVQVAGTLEHVADGIVLRGSIHAAWQGSCSRCLRPVAGEIVVHVDELFEPAPLAGETYLLEEDVLDLAPLLRDAVLLELPGAPLCAEDCAGICPTCGADHNEVSCECVVDEPDPRWAALRSLEL